MTDKNEHKDKVIFSLTEKLYSGNLRAVNEIAIHFSSAGNDRMGKGFHSPNWDSGPLFLLTLIDKVDIFDMVIRPSGGISWEDIRIKF